MGMRLLQLCLNFSLPLWVDHKMNSQVATEIQPSELARTGGPPFVLKCGPLFAPEAGALYISYANKKPHPQAKTTF